MIPRLKDWMDPVLKRLCDATDVQDFLPGDKLAEKDQEADAAYVLMRGGLHLCEGSSTTRKSRMSTMFRMSVFSNGSSKNGLPLTIVEEQCLFELAERVTCKHTVVASECSEVLRVDRQQFQQVLQTNTAGRSSKAHSHGRRDGESTRSRGDGTVRTNPTVINNNGRSDSWEDDDDDSFGGDLNDNKPQMQEVDIRPAQKKNMFGMHMVRQGTMGFGALVAGQTAVS